MQDEEDEPLRMETSLRLLALAATWVSEQMQQQRELLPDLAKRGQQRELAEEILALAINVFVQPVWARLRQL
jgi:hypothetical protein